MAERVLMSMPCSRAVVAKVCPCGIISTSRKSPAFSRGFKVSSLIFDPFPNQESSRKKRRIAGGVLLSTCNSQVAGRIIPVFQGRFKPPKSSIGTPFSYTPVLYHQRQMKNMLLLGLGYLSDVFSARLSNRLMVCNKDTLHLS